jgi:alkaline phosphatase
VIAAVALAVAGVSGAAAAQGSGSETPTAAARQAIEGGTAKNVILFLGDGMSDSEVTIARVASVSSAPRWS